ncbi:MAG: hypothetical protein AB7I27_14135 [Bacteriovoracaceae bacterium]
MNKRKNIAIKRFLKGFKKRFRSDLFSEDAGHELYLSIKNNERFRDIKHYCYRLHRQFIDFCPDKAFPKKFAQSPVSHWWEMRLFDLFKINNFVLRKTKATGPDICFSHGKQIVWCEAIAPNVTALASPVVIDSPNDVPEFFHDVTYGEEESLIMKVTSAFKEKSEKMKKYIEQTIIPDNEPTIIAINVSNVRDADIMEDYNVPIVAQSLFGIDKQTISIPVFDGEGNRIIDGERKVTYPERRAVKKKADVLIPTTAFLGPENEHISAVIYSSKRLLDTPRDSKGLIVLINPFAKNRLDPDIFRFALVYYARGNILSLNKNAKKRAKKFNGF